MATSDVSTITPAEAPGEGTRDARPGFHSMATGSFKDRVGTNRMLPPMPPSPVGDVVVARARFIGT